MHESKSSGHSYHRESAQFIRAFVAIFFHKKNPKQLNVPGFSFYQKTDYFFLSAAAAAFASSCAARVVLTVTTGLLGESNRIMF
jgi:hypothetical protein